MTPPIRHTAQRSAVLRAVKLTLEPTTVTALKQLVPKMSVSTLYRNLDILCERGEIAVIERPDGVTRYIGRPWHEAEFRCVRCGKRRHLKHQSLPGYVDRKMFGHQVIITSQLMAQGICGSCATTSPRVAPPHARRGA